LAVESGRRGEEKPVGSSKEKGTGLLLPLCAHSMTKERESMRTGYVLGVLACGFLLLGASSAQADGGVPVKDRPTVKKGLEWLVSQQNKRDGHWEAKGGQYPVTMTALGGMALLCEGSTVRAGKYARNIRLARDWLISRAQPSGQIGNPNIPGEAGRYM